MKQNIVIFSSGVSEQHGLTAGIHRMLTEMGYACMDWRGLFSIAKHADNIALLPMLIKKIPTFDFAVLICEGHDITQITRNGSVETVKTMRDNVLFEIGLCAMAIGLNRTILITDTEVRIPDDLRGINGDLAVKRICIGDPENSTDPRCFASVCHEIHKHIQEETQHVNQVVIGAAASGACGYASNFIFRTLEHIHEELILTKDDEKKTLLISPDKVYVHIRLPETLNEKVMAKIRQAQSQLLRGTIPTARSRPANFNCYLRNGELHIVDHPTNTVTSYNTARMILDMDADDIYDADASSRFVAKEMTLYEATLQKMMNEGFVRSVVEAHYKKETEAQREQYIRNVTDIITKRLTIERFDGQS